MPKETLNFANIHEGELVSEVNAAMLEVQDAIFKNKGGKGSVTVKVNFEPHGDSGQILGVTTEVSKSIPKTKRKDMYPRGKHYLEAEVIYPQSTKQESIKEVDNVVDLNRKAQ